MGNGPRGDAKNAVTQYGTKASGAVDPLVGSTQQNYNAAAPQAQQGYNQVMGGYSDFLGGKAMGPGSGYNTGISGGVTPTSIQSPSWNNNTGFTGGYSPGATPSSPAPNIASWAGGSGRLSNYVGPSNPLDPGVYQQLTADLGIGNDRSPQQIATISNRLRQAGYDVQNGPISGDQQDSLIINGQLYRLFDSSGRWNAQADNPNAPAWDMPGQGGSAFTAGGFPGAINSALSGYGDFALTGGFTPQQLQDLRSRAVAPIKSVYQQARADVDQNKALSGGYSPNANAATTKLAREQGYLTSEGMTNANAAIAQAIQQGKLAGLSGLSQTGLLGQGQNLQALSGMTGMYGQQPGLASMYGNQALNAAQLSSQLNQGLLGNYINAQQLPTGFQQFMGNWGPIISGGLGAVL